MANDIVKYKEQWATAAEQAASREEVTGGSFIKLAGGIFKLGEDELPGNKLCAIVLADVFENTYYDDKLGLGVRAHGNFDHYTVGRATELRHTLLDEP